IRSLTASSPLSPTLALCFFCCSYRFLPYLHSFPTRRSSDLLARRNSGRGARDGGGGVGRRGTSVGPGRRTRGVGLHRALPVDAQDRKSTRLNSSHVKISYAVFCLKKKNRITHSHPTIYYLGS